MKKTYAAIHKDLNVRMQSRSGGFFTALSDYVLVQNGVVYGCVLDENFLAIHVRATEKSVRDKMRGSKYIQSDMRNALRELKKDIADGRLVLFTGTACQIAAVRSMFNQTPENLILMDVVCHGVPSPLVWKNYIQWVEKKFSGKCSSAEFRNKTDFGWRAHIETLRLGHDASARKVSQDYFKTLFYRHNVLRPACFRCPYRSLNRVADISIADCWEIEKAAPQMDDNLGVSLILLETEKGESIFRTIQSELETTEVDIKKCMPPVFAEPFTCPKERASFWTDFYYLPFGKVLNKYADYGMRYSLQKEIKEIKHKIKVCLLRK